jgi:hypothetical protein
MPNPKPTLVSYTFAHHTTQNLLFIDDATGNQPVNQRVKEDVLRIGK